MRLVFVEWVDSYGCSSNWEELEGCSPQLMRCRSVGWLLHDDEDCKVLVPHVSAPLAQSARQGCGDMTIPTRSIVRLVDLPEPAPA